MFLGPFENLHEMLTREFGEGYYTDDNAVICGTSDEGVAWLWVVAPDQIKIEPIDGRPARFTYVLGALP